MSERWDVSSYFLDLLSMEPFLKESQHPRCDPGECSDTDALCDCLHRFVGRSHSLRADAGGQRVPQHGAGSNWKLQQMSLSCAIYNLSSLVPFEVC